MHYYTTLLLCTRAHFGKHCFKAQNQNYLRPLSWSVPVVAVVFSNKETKRFVPQKDTNVYRL